ncbi:DUF4157 domain-containing protein [Streptomyces sp. L2]|uniref:eCIS core domain-containing protein n=1 Tax=Streptomyces sp. L2 TaxID=2162665 RepID=UPI001010A6B9|nr:DUF4157 domain-containing protein [Streptomyces sp. L2]
MYAEDQARPAGARTGRAPARPSQAAGRTPFSGLLALQSTLGNAAVVQLLRRAGHDRSQEEHQHGAGCGHQETGQPVQRSTVHDVLRTGGRPLDDGTRSEMEARLGADFSDVRVHTGSAARASAAEIGARAYTSGAHVVLGEGGGDKHTLAHELTHVIQQRQGPVAGTDRGDGLRMSDPGDRFEREAEENATRAMSAAPPSPAAGPEQHAADSGGHEGHAGHGAGEAAVQRAILVVDHETNDYSDMIENGNEVPRHPAFRDLGLPEDMMNHLKRLAEDDDGNYTVEEALARVRHTVTGGVNVVSKEEAGFLGDLAQRRGKVSSYDPDMMPMARSVLTNLGVPAGAVEVHKGSITAFGSHVPHTDIFVPHPGPWTKMEPPHDLASCLDEVMGSASHAYVLTDNEPQQNFAESLREGINRVNRANTGAEGHSPLTVTVKELEGPEGTEFDIADSKEPGADVPYRAHHRPDYRLVRVSRA